MGYKSKFAISVFVLLALSLFVIAADTAVNNAFTSSDLLKGINSVLLKGTVLPDLKAPPVTTAPAVTPPAVGGNQPSKYAPLSRNNFSDGSKIWLFDDSPGDRPKIVELTLDNFSLKIIIDSGKVSFNYGNKRFDCNRQVINVEKSSWHLGLSVGSFDVANNSNSGFNNIPIDDSWGASNNSIYCKSDSGEEIIIDYTNNINPFDREFYYSFRTNFLDGSCNMKMIDITDYKVGTAVKVFGCSGLKNKS